MAFEDIPHQDDAVRILQAVLSSGRMPHALLFLGPEGTGRARTAHELARVALCLDAPGPTDYCGECASCRRMAEGTHPDFLPIAVREDRRFVSIGQIRDAQDRIAVKPVLGPRRVVVIRQAERLTLEASNAFLKTLEEPPGDCLLILLAASVREIPETVVSRCRVVRFASLPADAVAERLLAEGVEPDHAEWLARRSGGSPGAAERFRRMELHLFNDQLVERLAELTVADNFELSAWLDAAAGSGSGSAGEAREILQELIECVAVYYRDSAAARRTVGASLARAEMALEAIEKIDGNANRRLTLDNLFTQLARRTPGSA